MPDAFPDRGAIRFRQPRDVGDVLNATIALIRANARELLLSYVAVVAPVALATGVATGLYFHQMGGLLADPTAIEDDPFAIFNATYAGILLFGLLGSALVAAAAAGYVRLYREGLAGEITASLLWEEARGLLLPFLGMPLLYGLLMMLTAVVNIVPCLGALAWVGVFVWSIPYYCVTLAARTLEEPTLVGAVQRARDLVKGEWGPTFGALLLAGLLFYVILMIVSIPLYVVMMVVGINTIETDPGAMFSMMGAVMAPLQVVSYAGYLLPLLATFFVHGRLVEDLDGIGLRDDLDTLAGDLDTRQSAAFAPPASTPPALDDLDGPLGDPDGTPPEDDPDLPPGGFRGGGFRS